MVMGTLKSSASATETVEERQPGDSVCLCWQASPASRTRQIDVLKARRAAVEQRLHDLDPGSTADQEV